MNEATFSYSRNGTKTFTPKNGGTFICTLGNSKGGNFGRGKLEVAQNGVVFPGLEKLEHKKTVNLFFRAGMEVTLSEAKKPNLKIDIGFLSLRPNLKIDIALK